MKKSLKKLSLHRETLQRLDGIVGDALAGTDAGIVDTGCGSECSACGQQCFAPAREQFAQKVAL